MKEGAVNAEDNQIDLDHLGLLAVDLSGSGNQEDGVPAVRGEALLTALMEIPVVRNNTHVVPWYRTLREASSLMTIYGFLREKGTQKFTRTQFAGALDAGSDTGKGKYKTAGEYLKRLHTNGIVRKNEKKANKTRFWLSNSIYYS